MNISWIFTLFYYFLAGCFWPPVKRSVSVLGHLSSCPLSVCQENLKQKPIRPIIIITSAEKKRKCVKIRMKFVWITIHIYSQSVCSEQANSYIIRIFCLLKHIWASSPQCVEQHPASFATYQPDAATNGHPISQQQAHIVGSSGHCHTRKKLKTAYNQTHPKADQFSFINLVG